MGIKKPCPYKQTLELIFRSFGIEPVREFKFHPVRKWKIDFAFPDLKLAVEYEGMAFSGGKSRHTTIGGFSNDAEKYNEISLMGWKLLRFNAKLVASGLAHDQIKRAVEGGLCRKQ